MTNLQVAANGLLLMAGCQPLFLLTSAIAWLTIHPGVIPMALCKQILEVIVGICVTTGTALGVIKFVKAYKKEKREARIRANQHLVKAEYRRNQTQTKRLASDLYVVNADTRPVTAVYVDFFRGDNDATPRESRDCGCLSPGGEFLINQSVIALGTRRYKSAKFTYTDANGHKHEYEQNTIV